MLNQHLCKEKFSEGMRVEGQSNKLSMRENGIFLVMEQGNICTAFTVTRLIPTAHCSGTLLIRSPMVKKIWLYQWGGHITEAALTFMI